MPVGCAPPWKTLCPRERPAGKHHVWAMPLIQPSRVCVFMAFSQNGDKAQRVLVIPHTGNTRAAAFKTGTTQCTCEW